MKMGKHNDNTLSKSNGFQEDPHKTHNYLQRFSDVALLRILESSAL